MNTILLILLIVGLFWVYAWHVNRAIQDADALAWATASEPFVVISRHHSDTNVTKEANYIREQLRKHGNSLLKTPGKDDYKFAVIEHVYSADALTTSRDFNVWLDLALIDAQRQREAFRKQRLEWNESAAKEKFGGQTVYTVDHVNGQPQNTTQQ